MKTPMDRLRLVARLEGVSFLLLLGVAMPLKYMWDEPLAVRVVGMAHGVLFLLLGYMLLASELPFKLKAQAFGASLLPFGPFLIDGKLRAAGSQALADSSSA